MSAKASFWAWQQTVPATQKLVLLALSNRHNADTGRCDPSLSKVSEDCGLARTAIKDAIRALCDAGLITAIPRSIDGSSISNLYRFNFAAGVQVRLENDPAMAPTDEIVHVSQSGGRSPDDLGGVATRPGVGRLTTGGRSPDDPKPITEPEREPTTEPDMFGADAPLPVSKQKALNTDTVFDQFWNAYPNKKEKKGARAKFDAAVKSGVDPAKIVAAAKSYAVSDQVKRGFAKHPTTWLTNGCWDDETAPAAAVHVPLDQAPPAERLRREATIFRGLGDYEKADRMEARAAQIEAGAA